MFFKTHSHQLLSDIFFCIKIKTEERDIDVLMEVRRTVSPEQAPTMSSTTFPAHLPNGTTASSCSSVHDSLQGPARHVSPSSGDAGALECSKSISSSNAVHDECLSGTNEGASALSERNASKTASCTSFEKAERRAC